MVRHVVMWKLDDKFTIDEKKIIAETFKSNLEALRNLMEGVMRIEVVSTPLASSNVDIMLVSEFDKQTTLDAYQVHPKHVEVASYLKGKVVSRNCMDYEI
ncbi:MAG: Dabb family protein [Erysipelotrichia bacterium]|nr:Dabb family protein [Erysipelotrichia bacterium]NCC54691.1 Dabb family protein [Erysipelotrichia bacterium]